MLRVVVRPGQTLWSIATKADPSADPRVVIQQIIDDNALSGTTVSAGQVLWVPRS
jgi:LysM repeat protein